MTKIQNLQKDAAEQLAEQFRMLRAKHKLTQDEVAAAAGISRLTYNSIERGQGNPSRDIMVSIAAVFKTKISFTFNPEV